MAKIKSASIKCGHCGDKFPSPIFLGDTETFDSATVSGNIAQCPKCGGVVNCNRENMSYELADTTGGFVGDERDHNKA